MGDKHNFSLSDMENLLYSEYSNDDIESALKITEKNQNSLSSSNKFDLDTSKYRDTNMVISKTDEEFDDFAEYDPMTEDELSSIDLLDDTIDIGLDQIDKLSGLSENNKDNLSESISKNELDHCIENTTTELDVEGSKVDNVRLYGDNEIGIENSVDTSEDFGLDFEICDDIALDESDNAVAGNTLGVKNSKILEDSESNSLLENLIDVEQDTSDVEESDYSEDESGDDFGDLSDLDGLELEGLGLELDDESEDDLDESEDDFGDLSDLEDLDLDGLDLESDEESEYSEDESEDDFGDLSDLEDLDLESDDESDDSNDESEYSEDDFGDLSDLEDLDLESDEESDEESEDDFGDLSDLEDLDLESDEESDEESEDDLTQPKTKSNISLNVVKEVPKTTSEVNSTNELLIKQQNEIEALKRQIELQAKRDRIQKEKEIAKLREQKEQRGIQNNKLNKVSASDKTQGIQTSKLVSQKEYNKNNKMTAQDRQVMMHKKYASMTDDVLAKHVKNRMEQLGVRKHLIDKKQVENQFGSEAINRLIKRGAIVAMGNKLTF